jgi:phage-related minor tail protein
MLHGRRDSTHAEIRDELRALGASVADTADLGHDFPDLVVGVAGATFLVEAKAAKGKLSDGQSKFAETWRGAPVVVLRSKVEAREWVIRTRHERLRESRNAAQSRSLTPVVVRRLAPLVDGFHKGETPEE